MPQTPKSSSWHYAGLVFAPLFDADLPQLAKAIDNYDVRRCLTYYNKETVLSHLQEQARRDRERGDITFSIYNQHMRPLGFAGLLPYRGGFETITYLAESAKRTGTNSACKHMQWAISQMLDATLYAGVKPWNKHSIAAMSAHWPDIEPTQTEDFSANYSKYSSYCWTIDSPPVRGHLPTQVELDGLAALLVYLTRQKTTA